MRFISTLLVAGLAICAAPSTAQETGVPLRLLAKSVEHRTPAYPPDSSPQRILRFTLRNEGNRTITAWSFDCLFADGEGRKQGFTGFEVDNFTESRSATRLEDPRNGLLFPGDKIRIEMPGQKEWTEDRFAVTSCRVSAVVFEGGGFAGDEKIARRFLDDRAEIARAVRTARDVIREMTAERHGETTSNPELLEAIGRGLTEKNRWYLDFLRSAIPEAERGGETRPEHLERLLRYLDHDEERLRGHLSVE